jgi:hypothetical protein
MSKFVSDRRLIVRRILDIINPDGTDADVDLAMTTWWQNIRQTGGFQLTVYGDQQFRLAELEYYDIDCGPVQNSLSAMAFHASSIKLDKKMPAPFYLIFKDRCKYIRVYDSRVALMIAMYDDINKYLESLEDD